MDSNTLLHEVAKQAQKDEIDAANPSNIPKTDDQLDQERKEEAEELGGQVMDLE